LAQRSELLPVPGVDYVGPLPEGAQQATIFSAAIAAGARAPQLHLTFVRPYLFGVP